MGFLDFRTSFAEITGPSSCEHVAPISLVVSEKKRVLVVR